jgi:hypothetical protein
MIPEAGGISKNAVITIYWNHFSNSNDNGS